MITKISIENFKGIGDRIELPIRPITLLFGPNSGGKSTIHHAMLYAFEVLDRHNCDAHGTVLGGDSVDLGGFDEMVHRHDRSKTIRLRFDLDLSRENLLALFPVVKIDYDDTRHGEVLADIGHNVKSAWVELAIHRDPENDPPKVSEYLVGLDGVELAKISSLFAPIVNLHHPILAWPTPPEPGTIPLDARGTHGPLDAFCPALLNGYDRMYREEDPEEEVQHEELLKRQTNADECTVISDVKRPLDEIVPGSVRRYRQETPKDGLAPVDASVDVYIGRDVKTGAPVCCWAQFVADFRDAAAMAIGDGDLKNWSVDDLAMYFADEAKTELQEEKWDQQFRFHMGAGALPDLESPLKFAKPIETVRGAPPGAVSFTEQLLTRLIVGPGRVLRDHLKGVRYLGPLRQSPPRDHVPPAQSDPSRWPSGLGAWDALAAPGAGGLARQVSNWLGPDHLDTGYRLAVRDVGPGGRCGDPTLGPPKPTEGAPVSEGSPSLAGSSPAARVVFLHDIARQVDLPLCGVGVGLSQVIPVLTLALMEDATVCIMEQPELHLHPRQQAALGDLLIEAACRKQKQLLVETHSEHMILRLLRRIRETTRGATSSGDCPVTPKDVAVYYVRPENGQTKVLRIDVDDNGEFVQPWPDDFFEIDFYERFG